MIGIDSEHVHARPAAVRQDHVSHERVGRGRRLVVPAGRMDVSADDDHVAARRVHRPIRRVEESRVQARRTPAFATLGPEVHVVARFAERDPPSHLGIPRDGCRHEVAVIRRVLRHPGVIAVRRSTTPESR